LQRKPPEGTFEWEDVIYVKFHLDIDKAIAATAYLIQKAGGRFDVFVLIKTLAWAERNTIIAYGTSITGDRLVSMDKGPVVSGIYDLIKGKEIKGHPEALKKWGKHIMARESHVLRIKECPDMEVLSVREIEIIDAAFRTISQIPSYWLAAWTHENFPEWKDPKGSSLEIDRAEILKTAKKSNKEIEAINEEITSINLMKSFLGR
jgi:hypothetical protein